MIKSKPSVFVKSTREGMEMVKRLKGKYAFFAETTAIELYKHKDCTLTQISDKLDTKEYGIAMPMSE